MKEIKGDLEALRNDLSEIKARLSRMPTTFQVQMWFVGIATGLVGLSFAIAQVLAR